MQPSHPQSPARRRTTLARPVAIQPLEGRRLMSAGIVVEAAVWLPPPVGTDGVAFGPTPAVPMFGPGFGFGFEDGAGRAVTTDAPTPSATVTPVAVAAVVTNQADANATPPVPIVEDSPLEPATPAVAAAAAPRDLSAAAADGWTTPRPAAGATPAAAPAQPALFATGGIVVPPAAAGAVSPVSTVGGDIVPTALTAIARTPFATADMNPSAPAMAVGAAADVAVPVPESATSPTGTAAAFDGAPGSTVAAPSFGETVIDAARAAHPLALAVAAGAAAALWVSTESARDRRREQLSQATAMAAAGPFADGRLVALGLFRD